MREYIHNAFSCILKLETHMFIDTHTHIYVKQFDKDREEMLNRAIDQGVETFFMPNIDLDSIESMLNLEGKHPNRCHAMMGLHPCSVGEDFEAVLSTMRAYIDKRSFAAIGEIGIDLYWEKKYFSQQEMAFRQQIEWAKEFDVPIVIHCRDATPEVLRILADCKDEKLRGIFHCFGGSEAEAKQIIDLGFLLGIGGVLTFKKSGLDNTLKDIDLAHIVLETDSPYLAPVPYRGKRNESGYLRLVAEKLSEVKGVSIEQIGQITSENARRIFQMEQKKA